MFKVVILFFGLTLPAIVLADNDSADNRTIPTEIKPFIERGTRLLTWERADLNGDKKDDYIIVLEKQKKPGDPDIESKQRPFLIVTRNGNGRLELAKRNDRIVYCSRCGGMMGDPFVGVTARRKSFTVEHYGGSAWRWSNRFTFNYSRIDNTWQLVEVEEESFHTGDPEGGESRRYTPPKDYGKIDIANFDPDNWKKKRRK
jgi:hypothetical protein